jgi:long-chain acyl-CoA synthetase
LSWRQLLAWVDSVAERLHQAGVRRGERVAVWLPSRAESVVALLACARNGYICNPSLHQNYTAAEIIQLLQRTRATAFFMQSGYGADAGRSDIVALAQGLPSLKAIFEVSGGDTRVQPFPAPGLAPSLAADPDPDKIVYLAFTSGTTGPPKGVMLTAANVDFAIQELIERGGFTAPPPSPRDSVLSYLPLCHVAERIFSGWFGAGAGVCVHFAESIETVATNLHEVQPTVLFGVPRIWEKIAAGVQIRVESADPVKRAIGGFWLRRADWIGDVVAANGGRHTAASRAVYAVGWLFCYRALKDRLGLRKVRYAASGAAPIAPEVLRFFMGLGLPMHEVYGMTENTAVATANRPGRVKVGTVGEPHDGVEVRIDESTGEILTRHPGTFAGYWHDPDATAAVIEPDGWLHTGDVGEWVDGTHLRITDRMKDIIITAGGKNVAPSEIENALKASPYIKEALVVGDRRRFLAALIGIEPDTVGHWAQLHRLPYSTYGDLSAKPEVIALVQTVVDEVNVRFATVEQVRSFRLLPKLLDHEDGELTATQKLKRSAVTTSFADLVESMYAGEAR